jgi:hypothetical protein
MKRKSFLLGSLAVLVIAFTVAWLSLSGRVQCLTLNRHLAVEVNGLPVAGEILEGKFTAIVTRRDAGKKHSYQLFFEGDVDSTGDMGSVVDCHEWVAPHLPFLPLTKNYPPCKHLPEDGPALQGRRLILRGNAMQFATKDQSTISVLR